MPLNRHNQEIVNQFSKQAEPFAKMPAHMLAMDLMMEMARPSLADTALDVACGPGLLACAFAKRMRHVTGIDITPAMIDKARELQQKEGLANVTWKVGDINPLPFADEAFSMVLTRYSFHHFTNPKKVFGEMHRVCQSGGTLMVVDVALPPEKRERYDHVERLRDPSHTSALTPEELLAIARELHLGDIRTQRYELDMNLEELLARSFPKPGAGEKIRAIFREDVGNNRLGVAAHWVCNEIHFAFPIVILTGRKMAHG